ncbi:MAG: glycosyltransferase family 2 protein [Planctomycetota bacterium]
MLVLGCVVLGLAGLPLGMVLVNLGLLRGPGRVKPTGQRGEGAGVSVLIPARDEAEGIEAAVRAALAGLGDTPGEVVVLDDHSSDDTAAIVRGLADEDARVRLESAPELPGGWNGKQHACWVLAQRSVHDVMVWVDADVRLAPGSVPRLAEELRGSGIHAKLLSGVPRQATGTWLEVLIVPQILLVLLGYLPIARMRSSAMPGLGAGCGQLFVADRAAYFECGGHRAIRGSVHDGVDLPRLFRRSGFITDLFDATATAGCRMYTGAAATWRGFSKNATAGMAAPQAIGVWTVLLLGGHVLPWAGLAAAGLVGASGAAWGVWAGAALCAAGSSVAIAWRFGQGFGAALARPMGVAVLVALQWVALGRSLAGHRPTWRGRAAVPD